MARYMVLHTYKKSPEEFWKFFGEQGPGLARQMAAGEIPAKCIKSWNPSSYGRNDYIFCLWEADKPEQVDAALALTADYITWDIIQVDEIDWAELAKAAVPLGQPVGQPI